jgi:riboflavin synthase
MFTGIVEEVGRLRSLTPTESGARIVVECHDVLTDAYVGSSIAVNGVCLTAVELATDCFAADLAPETLRLTNLGKMQAGSLVNLERPLLPSVRLSGHIVQGHVDGMGKLEGLDQTAPDAWWLRVRVPAELDRYVVYKGSIAIDGISLTVARIEDRLVSVAIIPHTYEHTALRDRRPGDLVNLETDVVAKYVEKMIGARATP